MANGKSESALLPVAMIFGGCMCSILAMEYVLKGDPKAGNLFSLTKTLVVLVPRLPRRFVGFRPVPLAAPVASHMQFTLLWSAMSILANYGFSFKISMTMFTMVRSSNLIATVTLGWLFFGYRYRFMHIFCVCAVSVGIFLASMGEAKSISVPSANCLDCSDVPPNQSGVGDASASGDGAIGMAMLWDPYGFGKSALENAWRQLLLADGPSLRIWAVGMTMLAVVQLLQGFLGHVQHGFYKKYAHLAPKNQLADEYLFTSQVVTLVPLTLMWDDLSTALRSALQSEATPIIPLPTRVVWLILHSIADAVCVTGVFRASSMVSPLALTIILTVRKFLSTVVSIVWFGSPWTTLHSVALVLIFGGVFVYSQTPDAEHAPVAAGGADKSDKSD